MFSQLNTRLLSFFCVRWWGSVAYKYRKKNFTGIGKISL